MPAIAKARPLLRSEFRAWSAPVGKTGKIQRRRAGQRLGRLRWLLARTWGLDAKKSSLSSPRTRPGRGRGLRALRYNFPIGSAEGRMEQSGADRRALLKLGAAGLTGAAVSPGSGAAQNSPGAAQGLKSLPRVDIAADRITRRIAGLRPFRPSGFVVRA